MADSRASWAALEGVPSLLTLPFYIRRHSSNIFTHVLSISSDTSFSKAECSDSQDGSQCGTIVRYVGVPRCIFYFGGEMTVMKTKPHRDVLQRELLQIKFGFIESSICFYTVLKLIWLQYLIIGSSESIRIDVSYQYHFLNVIYKKGGSGVWIKDLDPQL